MIYSSCTFLSNVCWFVYDWYHVMVKPNIIKTLDFFILLEIKQSSRFILKSLAVITASFKM